MLEAPDSPDAIHVGTTPPGVPGRAPTRDARLRGLVTHLEARVPGAAAHGRRVAAQCRLIALRLRIEEPVARRLECAARIHDVGKVVVAPEILAKPGPLSPLEYVDVQRHATIGAEMAARLGDPELAAIVRHHHERLDGSGYPDGLRGAEIPLGARIVAVADTFDALTSYRPYRETRSPGAALRLIEAEAGTTLDPGVVAAFAL